MSKLPLEKNGIIVDNTAIHNLVYNHPKRAKKLIKALKKEQRKVEKVCTFLEKQLILNRF